MAQHRRASAAVIDIIQAFRWVSVRRGDSLCDLPYTQPDAAVRDSVFLSAAKSPRHWTPFEWDYPLCRESPGSVTSREGEGLHVHFFLVQISTALKETTQKTQCLVCWISCHDCTTKYPSQTCRNIRFLQNTMKTLPPNISVSLYTICFLFLFIIHFI